MTNQQGAIITFPNFKHSYNQPPISLVIWRQQDRSVCPVQQLLDYMYLQLRGPCADPLFLNEALQPVSRKAFANLLALVFCHSGLPLGKYKSHS